MEEIAPGSDPIDVGACVKRGFVLTKRHFGISFSVGLVYAVSLVLVGIARGLLDSALGSGGAHVG